MKTEIVGDANTIAYRYALEKAGEARDYLRLVMEQEGCQADIGLAEAALQNAQDREDWAFMEGDWSDLRLEEKLQERKAQFDLQPEPVGQHKKRRRN